MKLSSYNVLILPDGDYAHPARRTKKTSPACGSGFPKEVRSFWSKAPPHGQRRKKSLAVVELRKKPADSKNRRKKERESPGRSGEPRS